jgi:hypothetical protein
MLDASATPTGIKHEWCVLATGWSAGNFYTFFIECFDFDIMFLILFLIQLVAIRLVSQWCFFTFHLNNFIYTVHCSPQCGVRDKIKE